MPECSRVTLSMNTTSIQDVPGSTRATLNGNDEVLQDVPECTNATLKVYEESALQGDTVEVPVGTRAMLQDTERGREVCEESALQCQ